jgi:DNA-binding MarR family transcriptional regulator
MRPGRPNEGEDRAPPDIPSKFAILASMHGSAKAGIEAQAATVERVAEDLNRLVRYLRGGATGSPLDAVAELELSFSQARTLAALDRIGGSASIGKLAEQLPLSQGATSRVVEGLQRGGLVERQEDLTDRRIKRVRITPAGRETVARFGEFREAKTAALRELLAQLEPDEREQFGKLLARIVALPALRASEAPIAGAALLAEDEGAERKGAAAEKLG